LKLKFFKVKIKKIDQPISFKRSAHFFASSNKDLKTDKSKGAIRIFFFDPPANFYFFGQFLKKKLAEVLTTTRKNSSAHSMQNVQKSCCVSVSKELKTNALS